MAKGTSGSCRSKARSENCGDWGMVTSDTEFFGSEFDVLAGDGLSVLASGGYQREMGEVVHQSQDSFGDQPKIIPGFRIEEGV